MNIGDRIKKVRKSLDLTQEAFATRIGSVQNTITGYESGRRNPSAPVISLICKEFKFYTYSKLQGSQTSNCHHRTYILGCIVVSKYYFTIKHLSLSIIKILLSPNSFLSSDSINNIETFL